MDADIPAAFSQLVCPSQLALRCACCCAGWVGFLRKPPRRLCLHAVATPRLQRTPTVFLWRSLRPPDHLRCRLCRAGNQLLAPAGTVFRPDRWASPSHGYRSGWGPLEARCHNPVACPASRAGSGALPPRWPSAACRPTGSWLASESIAAPPPAAAGPWLRPREIGSQGTRRKLRSCPLRPPSRLPQLPGHAFASPPRVPPWTLPPCASLAVRYGRLSVAR